MTDSKQEQRINILKASSELFNETGFANTSVRRIAKRAGVSEPQLYRRFDEEMEAAEGMDFKQVILIALFKDTWFNFNQVTETVVHGSQYSNLNAREKIFFLWRSLLSSIQELSTLGVSFVMEIRQHGRLGEMVVKAGMDRFASLIDDLITQGQKDGVFLSNLHPQALRQEMIGCGENILVGWIWKEQAAYPADYTIDDACAVYNAFLNGVCTEKYSQKGIRENNQM